MEFPRLFVLVDLAALPKDTTTLAIEVGRAEREVEL